MNLKKFSFLKKMVIIAYFSAGILFSKNSGNNSHKTQTMIPMNLKNFSFLKKTGIFPPSQTRTSSWLRPKTKITKKRKLHVQIPGGWRFSFMLSTIYYCLQFSRGNLVSLYCVSYTHVSKIYCKIHTSSDWSPMYPSMTCFCNRNKRDDDRCTIDCFFSILSNLVQKVHFLMDYLLPDDKRSG